MMDSRHRQTIQAVLDAIATHVFHGSDVLLTLEAVVACKGMFPKILVDIAVNTPKEERSKLMFRSGRCLPMSQHAGQKQKAVDNAKEEAAMEPPKTEVEKTYIKSAEIINLLTQAGKNGLDSKELAELAGVSSGVSSKVLWSHFARGTVTRKEIESDTKSPRYRYFLAEK